MAVALFDSNILIDALNGIPQAMTEICYYQHIAISSMTWMELMAKPLADQNAGIISAGEMHRIRSLVSTFTVLHTDDFIMTEAANIRAQSLQAPPKLALPDAIILATALVTGRLLVTRNKKDFRGANVRFPYELRNAVVCNIAPPPTP